MSENSGYGHSTLDAFLGTAPRRGRRHFVGIFLLVVVIVAALFLAVRFFAGSQRPYYFASAEVGDLAPQVSEQGIVRGMHDHAIRSRMNGIVARLAVTASGPVKRGQELARIDAGPLEQLLEADEAGLDGASAELRAAQTIAAEKSERFVRFERVWKESAGRVPSRNEMAAARAGAAQARQNQAAAEARLRAARLVVEARSRQIDATVVRAPFTGFLDVQGLRVGQHVRAGSILFRLTPDNDALTVSIPWKEGGAVKPKPGARAAVRFDDRPEITSSATFVEIDNEGRAVFALEKSAPDILPGMKVTLNVALPERHNALLVPNAALAFAPDASADRARAQVYLLGEDELPRREYVTAGGTDGKRTEIFSSAVKPGAQIIIGLRDAPD